MRKEDELLEAYVETRRQLIRAADGLTRRIAAMEPIRTLDRMNELLELDRQRKLVIGMISDCSYVIDWLTDGRCPGSRRGIERRAGYQREVPTDPAKLPTGGGYGGRYASPPEADDVEEDEREAGRKRRRLEAALRGLTERERDCYTLAYGACHSFDEVARLLGISKSSVGTYMMRARRKIADNVAVIAWRVG